MRGSPLFFAQRKGGSLSNSYPSEKKEKENPDVVIWKFVSNLPANQYTVSKGLPLSGARLSERKRQTVAFVDSMVTETIWGIIIPFLGTSLGALCVLLLKGSLNRRLQRIMAGFAAGVMVAASIWSLIIPAMEQTEGFGKLSFLPALIGFWLGILFLLLLDTVIPHLHMNADKAEGPRSRLKKTTMMALDVALG